MNKVEFGEWVRQQRGYRQWTQADLARESGLYRSLINNIENGVSESAPKTLSALAHAFKLDTQYLFELVELLPPKSEATLSQRLLLHASEGLPESDLQLALSLLEQRREFYKKNPGAKPAK